MSSNQKCGVVIGIILLLLSGFILAGGIAEGSVSELLPAILFFGILGILPLILIWKKNSKRSRKNRSKKNVPITQSAPRSGYSEIQIHQNDSLPKICVTCGSGTRRTTQLDYDSGETHMNKYDWSRLNPFLALFLFFKVMSILIITATYTQLSKLWSKRKIAKNKLRFKIPHCSKCARKHPISQRHLDYHAKLLILHVRNEFAEAHTGTAPIQNSTPRKTVLPEARR